ncbi:MAG: hypothetical protein CVU16_11875 [Betaproteobacteria bacterium HGW-Betaproteobacteria-10]|nr:MAG: hypothetical protein CVU16_11875 [Betaproteobacteria bacterium HGW-Betaproteobacteria-10]
MNPAPKNPARDNGWADVWKRGHFGWENKKPDHDLSAALKQLTDYALQSENPPASSLNSPPPCNNATANTATTTFPGSTEAFSPVKQLRSTKKQRNFHVDRC